MNFALRLKYWDDYFSSIKTSLENCIHVPGILSFDTVACIFSLWRLKKWVFVGSTREPLPVISRMAAKANAQVGIVTESMLLLQDTIQIESLGSYFSIRDHDLNQLCTAIQSSGTMGEPSISFHTFSHHFVNAEAACHNAQFNEKSVWLISLPLFHISGLSIIMRALHMGARVCIASQRTACVLLQESRISHVSLVLTQLQEMLDNLLICRRLQDLTALVLGGGPMPASLWYKANKLDLPLIFSYGSTQMASQISATCLKTKMKNYNSGYILDKRIVSIGVGGELFLDGECLAANLKGPIASGDLGFFGSDKELHIIGRKDNLIISGGEKIQAEEVESALLECFGVLQAFVVAVQDKKYQQRPVAFIQMQNTCELSPKLLRQSLENRLAKYKIPDFFWDLCPHLKQVQGVKVNRNLLQGIAERILTDMSHGSH